MPDIQLPTPNTRHPTPYMLILSTLSNSACDKLFAAEADKCDPVIGHE
jgi:hypothetical protein